MNITSPVLQSNTSALPAPLELSSRDVLVHVGFRLPVFEMPQPTHEPPS